MLSLLQCLSGFEGCLRTRKGHITSFWYTHLREFKDRKILPGGQEFDHAAWNYSDGILSSPHSLAGFFDSKTLFHSKCTCLGLPTVDYNGLLLSFRLSSDSPSQHDKFQKTLLSSVLEKRIGFNLAQKTLLSYLHLRLSQAYVRRLLRWERHLQRRKTGFKLRAVSSSDASVLSARSG